MASQVAEMRFGGVDVLVATVSVAGTEPTSKLSDAGAKALDAFSRAHDVIVGAAASTVEVLGKLAAEAARPDKHHLQSARQPRPGKRQPDRSNRLTPACGCPAGAAENPPLAFDIQQLQALRDKVGHDEFAEQAAQILTSDQLLPILDLMNNAEA